MSDEEWPAPHNSHGRTPAAWITVTIMLIAFLVGTFGVVLAQMWIFWLGVALLIIGAIVGKILSMMGFGQYPRNASTATP